MNKEKSTFKQIPPFLCVGFFCHDVHKSGYILGGTAAYSSLIASKLIGQPVSVLTSVGADFLFHEKFETAGILVCNKLAKKTTIFNNVYQDDHRTQYIYERSDTLTAEDVPIAWRKAPVVKICLIANEVDKTLMNSFPDTLIGATIQGWLRKWDHTGKISPKEMDYQLLDKVDIVLMSEVDILGMEHILPKLVEAVEIVVMTKGAAGAVVYYQQETFHFPAFPVKEVDPTGAGDVFAVSFLVKYLETKSITLATTYAHAAASYVIEGFGVKLPNLETIEKRWMAYQDLFPELFPPKSSAIM